MPEKLSKKITPQVIAIVATIAFLAWGMYYFLREEPLPLPNTTQSKHQPADAGTISFKGSSIIEEQDGKRLWELNADDIETDNNTKKVRLVKVTGVFYQENENNGKIDLVAETALLDAVTKDIELKDQVKFTAENGAVLTASQAMWHNKERQFTASGGIALIREDVTITGETLEASPDLEKAVVKGNARVVKGAASNVE